MPRIVDVTLALLSSPSPKCNLPFPTALLPHFEHSLLPLATPNQECTIRNLHQGSPSQSSPLHGTHGWCSSVPCPALVLIPDKILPWPFRGVFVTSFLSRVLAVFLGIRLTPVLEKLLHIYKILKPNAHCCYYWIHLMNPNISGECNHFHLQFQQEIMQTFPSHRAQFFPASPVFSTTTLTCRAVDVQISISTYFSAKVKPAQTFQLHWQFASICIWKKQKITYSYAPFPPDKCFGELFSLTFVLKSVKEI